MGCEVQNCKISSNYMFKFLRRQKPPLSKRLCGGEEGLSHFPGPTSLWKKDSLLLFHPYETLQ